MIRPLLPLRSGEAWLALDALVVQEILGRCDWVPVPGAPAHLPGVLAWRGRAIALVDLAAAAGSGSPLSPGEGRERTIIIQAGGCTLALPVDSVREVHATPEESFHAPHATAIRWASAEADIDGTPMAVLDAAALVRGISEAA